jgi:2,3-bisphosphoglycerate-independent phosphoglycerate mutase
MDGVEINITPIKEHRFALVLRGKELGAAVTKTDPLVEGVAPLLATGLDEPSQKTAEIVNQYIAKVKVALAGEQPANMITLRGFDKLPTLAKYRDRYGLNAAAIAVNGMYKGVSRLAGMKILPVEGVAIEDEFRALEQNWNDFDFFYLHIKQTDTHGEDGDFDRKVQAIEEVDGQLARAIALKPDVIIITGDHSSPTSMKSHSWHPVPLLLYSRNVREDGIGEFGERACTRGSLGIMLAKDVMPLALANAGRISKYGA